MLIVAHMSFMISASLCFIAGVGIAMFGRRKKTWLKWHKTINSAGFCLLAAGVVTAITNVILSAGQHLAWVHQWIGLIAFLLAALTLFLGFYSMKAANKQAVRAGHRWSGRISGLAVLSALALGLLMIGVL
ncbi:MAG: hypothetical protein K4571_06265 [Deltaproteobacteria bacterium]